jgi:hypothetical protein
MVKDAPPEYADITAVARDFESAGLTPADWRVAEALASSGDRCIRDVSDEMLRPSVRLFASHGDCVLGGRMCRLGKQR